MNTNHSLEVTLTFSLSRQFCGRTVVCFHKLFNTIPQLFAEWRITRICTRQQIPWRLIRSQMCKYNRFTDLPISIFGISRRWTNIITRRRPFRSKIRPNDVKDCKNVKVLCYSNATVHFLLRTFCTSIDKQKTQ